VGEDVLPSAGKEASDGVQALQQSYGSYHGSPTMSRSSTSASKGVQADSADLMDVHHEEGDAVEKGNSRGREGSQFADDRGRDSRSRSTVRSLPKKENKLDIPTQVHRGPARSGSITENIIDVNGIRKVVLQTNSSSSNDEDENSGANKVRHDGQIQSRSGSTRLRGAGDHHNPDDGHSEAAKKKKRRRRKQGHGKGEQEPLMGEHR
jgi:metal transporter CNNM